MSDREYFVYIMTNPSHTVLYIGVTNNIQRRSFEHQQKLVPGFTTKYNCTNLVYAESCGDILEAIEREKQLKKWRREKKEWLINQENPEWQDLSEAL